MTTDLSARGLQSFDPVMEGFFGTRMMVERLKQDVKDLSEDARQLVNTKSLAGGVTPLCP